MDKLDKKRKLLNKQQTELRKAMTEGDQFDNAIQLFFVQHAMLHSRDVTQGEDTHRDSWSYEDTILNDMTEERIRCIPANEEHSIAWCFWHLARIEDTALNLLIAGTSQVFTQGNWLKRLCVPFRDTGNEMNSNDLKMLNKTIDIRALREYRVAVGKRTRAIVRKLKSENLKEKVMPVWIQRVIDEGAVKEAAFGITDYWSKRNIAGLLLMPATRHNLVHLNEASRLKKLG
jgi:hypothetical protein